MLSILDTDVLDIVVACIGASSREIDDVARDAASLAMVGSPAATMLSAKLWARVADLASVMIPDPKAQALASHCMPRTSLAAADVRVLAKACGVKYSYDRSMESLLLALDRSDEHVGPRCPIPRAAAVYVLHMICRHMAADVAALVFPGRDYASCRTFRGGLRFSDLRRAPKVPKPDFSDDRRAMMADLDRLFVGRPRPWYVRSQVQADTFFLRERLAAEGIEDCCEWGPNSLNTVRAIKAELRLVGRFGSKNGPDWNFLLRMTLSLVVPTVFTGCIDATLPWMFSVHDVRELKRRVLAHLQLIGSRERAQIARNKMAFRVGGPTMQMVLDAEYLDSQGLPVNVVYWGINDRQTLVAKGQWAAQVATVFNVPVLAKEAEFTASITFVRGR